MTSEQDTTISEELIDEVEGSLKSIDEGTGKFRFCAKKVFLTYAGHFNKGVYQRWIRNKLNGHDLKVIIAHEGEDTSTSYDHSHVLIESNKEIDIKNPRYFDYDDEDCPNPHPNIRKVATKKHLQNLYKYLCKEDKSNLHILEPVEKDKPICDKIWECETIQDAYRLYGGRGKGKCSQMEIRGYWNDKPYVEIESRSTIKLRNWQSIMMGFIHKTTKIGNDRCVTVIRGVTGGEGKSKIGSELRASNRGKWLVIGGTMDSWDKIGHRMCKRAEDKSWDQTGIVLDCGKKTKLENIPEIAEQIKMDTWSYGRYGGGDYENKGITQVVILCNRWPKFTDMSMDRWLAFDLKPTDDPTEPQIVKMKFGTPKKTVRNINAPTFEEFMNREPLYREGDTITQEYVDNLTKDNMCDL